MNPNHSTTFLQYEAPWPVHAMDWCKSPAPGQQMRPRSSYRLALGSFIENYANSIAIAGLPDERVLVDSDLSPSPGDGEYADFATLVEAPHGYPATSVQWQPLAAYGYAWAQKAAHAELLATTGDALRVWEYTSEVAPQTMGGFVGRQAGAGQSHSLEVKSALSGQSKVQNQSTGAPLTSFSWNEKAPSLVVTSSIDTTCTVWNIDTSVAITQLIAHDREVYDVAWLPGSTDIFVSVGADGSLRAFDLRSLEHSTILYETPAPKSVGGPAGSPSSSGRPPASPLLRIAFNPGDSNYMSTFHMDGTEIQILDMRSPGQPVIELQAHHGPVNALGWGSAERSLLATAGDDCQVLLWDLAGQAQQAATSPRSAGSRLNSPRPEIKKRVVTEPVMAYRAPGQVTNLAWSPVMAGGRATAGGEWVAIASGKTVSALRV